MKINALIVDDEMKVAKIFQNFLSLNSKDINVIGIANDVTTAIELINLKKPDLVFLDIVMPIESGFDLIRRVGNIDFEIVFVTSHDEYALQAIKCSAIGYLLKPVDLKEFEAVLLQVKSRINQKNKSKLYEILVHNLDTNKADEHKISIMQRNGFSYVKVSDIIRCEGWSRYTRIFIKNKKPIVSSYSIGKFADILSNYTFILSHRSHLINSTYIKEVIDQNRILMNDNAIVPISIRKKQEILTMLSLLKK